MQTTASRPKSGRIHLSPEQKALVRERYPRCLEPADKEQLARELGLPNVGRLYNLASRLGVTRSEVEDIDRMDRTKPPFSPERWQVREDPEQVRFSASDDAYIRRAFGRLYIELIADQLGRSETAVMVRARELGLRRFCRVFDARKAAAWLGVRVRGLRELGAEVWPLERRDGRHAIILVGTESLAEAVAGLERRLAGAGADRFFLAELAAARGTDDWERTWWVSHDHVCLNPDAALSFMLFDDGTDPKTPGADTSPAQLLAARPRRRP